MKKPQTYANHRRFDPLVHFVLLPFFLVTAGAAIWHAIKAPSVNSAWAMLIAIALVLLTLKVRGYSLRVQDRLIRLEEQLRMARLLPEDLKARIPELTERQFVGLRFASDGELADRVREALTEQLNDEGVKKRVQSWRPDTFRV